MAISCLMSDLTMHPACRMGPTDDRCLAWKLYKHDAILASPPILISPAGSTADCGQVSGTMNHCFLIKIHHRRTTFAIQLEAC